MVGEQEANLHGKVFFIWGSLYAICGLYAYLLIPETKALTLEQVDRMLEDTNPRASAKWRPNTDAMFAVQKQPGIVTSRRKTKTSEV